MTDQVLVETAMTGFLFGIGVLLFLAVIWSCIKTYILSPKKKVYDWKKSGDFK